jgi:radical SAM family RiPP maturation amino acid epimerase
VKRVFERFDGDPEFREACRKGGIPFGHSERLEQIGVRLDFRDLAFLAEISDADSLFARGSRSPPRLRKLAEDYPLLAAWLEGAGKGGKRNGGRMLRFPHNPTFDAWRSRRMKAAESEVGIPDDASGLPTIAIELSDGCSIGCQFCAFSAHAFTKALDYAIHEAFFSSILRTCLEVLGPEQALSTVLYFASEPCDTPRYLDFLKTYEAITGKATSTSTSAAHDEAWVRSLVDYYEKRPSSSLRLSILSTETLKAIHGRFTPAELSRVELAMRMKGSRVEKIASGRIFKEHEGLKSIPQGQNPHTARVPQGSICSLIGFAINLAKRRIRLVGPCCASPRWPSGYRVFSEASFVDERDFPEVLRTMIAENMLPIPQARRKIGFRDDLAFRKTVQGFELVSPRQIHSFRSDEGCEPVGEMIAAGDKTLERIVSLLAERGGVHPFTASMAVQKLYDDGFLDEIQD